jgi:hypothetical protein
VARGPAVAVPRPPNWAINRAREFFPDAVGIGLFWLGRVIFDPARCPIPTRQEQQMNVRILTVLAVALGLAEPATAIITSVEHVPNSEPVMLVLFLIPWLVGAALLQRGKVTAGAIVVGLLSLLDVVSFPGWTRTSALDWTTQLICAAAAAVCLMLAITTLVRQHRGSIPAGAAR